MSRSGSPSDVAREDNQSEVGCESNPPEWVKVVKRWLEGGLFSALLRLIETTSSVGFEHAFDLIADAAEDLHLLVLGSGGVGGIVEAPVVAIELAGEHRTRLISITTDSDDGLDVLAQKLIHVLAGVRADVEADLGHRFDGERVNITRRLRSGAGDLVSIAERGAQEAFGKVGAAGVAGAEDEDGGHGNLEFRIEKLGLSGLAAVGAAGGFAEGDGEQRAEDWSDQIDPEVFQGAGDQGGGEGAGGVHRGSANRAGEHGLQPNHSTDGDACGDALLFGSRGNAENGEHEDGGEHDLEHEALHGRSSR